MNSKAAFRSNRMSAMPNIRPLVISILSGKGGVGKSTTSYQLALVLSQHGRVMLVDADLLFGDLHIFANIMPQCTIDRFLLDENSLRQPAIINENLHLLASPSTSGCGLDFAAAGVVANLPRLPEICCDYDYLIVDTPSGVIDVIAGVASISHFRLISVMPELAAISDGYGLMKYLKTLGITGPHYLLPNRCRDEEEAAFIYAKFAEICKRFLKFRPECLGYIFENQRLKSDLRQGDKDLGSEPFQISTDDFRDLAGAIMAVGLKSRKTNLLNRPQTINAKQSAADIKG